MSLEPRRPPLRALTGPCGQEGDSADGWANRGSVKTHEGPTRGRRGTVEYFAFPDMWAEETSNVIQLAIKFRLPGRPLSNVPPFHS